MHRKCTVLYQGQYFTIISSISECDHKCATLNAKPQIGTNGLAKPRTSTGLLDMGSGFGQPESGSCNAS
jgi:hypothetical protein